MNESDLTDGERAVLAIVRREIQSLKEHYETRIATHNKFAAKAYLKPHEAALFDSAIRTMRSKSQQGEEAV